jgi:hypothetical protein
MPQNRDNHNRHINRDFPFEFLFMAQMNCSWLFSRLFLRPLGFASRFARFASVLVRRWGCFVAIFGSNTIYSLKLHYSEMGAEWVYAQTISFAETGFGSRGRRGAARL